MEVGMRFRSKVAACICIACACFCVDVSEAAQRVIADRESIEKTPLATATAGPSFGKRDARLETVALFPDTMLAGVVISPADGRVFLSFPRWNPVEFSAAELTKDGQLPAVPNREAHEASAGEKRLQSIQGIDFDAEGRLWVLDAGNATLHCVDLTGKKIIKTFRPSSQTLGKSAYANDVRIDLRRGAEGFGFISDTAGGGVIVMDLASGESWRRLSTSPAARSDPAFDPRVEGKPLAMRGHTDGIALSPDGQTLYFHSLSQRALFSVSADALTDKSLSDEQVNAKVRKIANKSSASDGIACDAQDRVYTTDYEDGAIRRWTPGAGEDQSGETIVQDERVLWPDALAVHGGYLYITTNQMNRLDKKQPPYGLFRVPVDAKGIGEK
jgi:sugar lactone lactonase YvrE